MKKFIIKIIVPLLLLIVFSYPLDLFISNNLKKSNTYAHGEFSVWNDIIEGELYSDLYIYGSSRAWVHFDPMIIQDSTGLSVYNLGMDGHRFIMQYLRHKLVLEHNKKPQYIIYSLDITTLAKGNLYNPDQFLPYMLWNNDFQEVILKYEGYNYFDFNIPFLRYSGKHNAIKESLRIFFKGDNPIKRIKGYEGRNESWNKDFIKAKNKMDSYTVNIDDKSLFLFQKFLSDCKKSNIQVILAYSPYYIKGQEFIKNQDEIIKMYNNLADKYNLDFFDFTKDSICYKKKYFYNSGHLNKDGAELFTKKLISMLKAKKLFK